MPERSRVGLDNPAFHGRLRTPDTRAQSMRVVDAAHRPSVRYFNDIMPAPAKPAVAKETLSIAASPLPIVHPQPFVKPALHKPQPTRVLRRPVAPRPQPAHADQIPSPPKASRRRRPAPHTAMMVMAALIFMIGLGVSLLTLQANHDTKTQVAALSQSAENSAGEDGKPSEDKPSPSAVNSYGVAPQLPKLLKISKLGVIARIKPLNVNSKGALQAPYNIYDAGWYNASAHPGDSAGNGAILIDGHVHGPTLPGVFVAIKKLAAGDSIQIVRGDGKTFTYAVVKVQNYQADKLDMAIALTSAKPGVAGLNLMTCGGPYDKESGEYTQRTIVFAVQI